MKNEIKEKFGGHLRVRVCGILIHKNQILMVKHRGLKSKGSFWSPPGGGAVFQSSLKDNLKREFLEETGLIVKVKEFLFINEFQDAPLHAIEFFFKVQKVGGSLITGFDPELDPKLQIIEDVQYFGALDFKKENGPQMHSVFRNLEDPRQILKLRGYFLNWK